MRNGLTFTVVLETSSANFGEGSGNISELKKITRGNGEVFTYISKQALKREMRTQMGLALTDVWYPKSKKAKKDDDVSDSSESPSTKGVVQFIPGVSIESSPELDLFGYMRTKEKEAADTRNAVVRVSNAFSLEPYSYDTDFMTNGSMAKRAGGDGMIVVSDNHKSLYAYNVNIDLDRIGYESDGRSVITKEERMSRISAVLNAIQYLHRDIRGDRKSLAPIFIIGGLYEIKNPFFSDTISVKNGNLLMESIVDTMEDDNVKPFTIVGLQKGRFENQDEIIETLNPLSVSGFFKNIKEAINENLK